MTEKYNTKVVTSIIKYSQRQMEIGTEAGFVSIIILYKLNSRFDMKALEHINNKQTPSRGLTIFVYSQAAIKAQQLNYQLCNCCYGGIYWVPEHCNVTGIDKADDLTRKGSAMRIPGSDGTKHSDGNTVH